MIANMQIVYDEQFGGIRFMAHDRDGQLIIQKLVEDANKGRLQSNGILIVREFATASGIFPECVELIPVKD